MKIIVVAENSKSNNKTQSQAFNIQEPIVSFRADSALLKDNKPFFVPDFTQQCSAGLHFVVRICRLGKSIPRRFAYRYYDAITVGVDFRADDVVERLRSENRPLDEGETFDGSAVIGRFVPFSDESQTHTISLSIDGQTLLSGLNSDFLWSVSELIERISRNNTLRQGDLLYCGLVGERFVPVIGQHLSVTLDGESLLEFNIK